jgi:hypothetical protein
MITQYEFPLLLKEAIPQMPVPVKIQASRFITTDIYCSMNSFSVFTKHAVDKHNFGLAKKCFAFAERLYRQGDSMVRLLIENIFVYSFSSFVTGNGIEKIMLKKMIPAALYAVYIKQVTSGGC